MVVYDGDSTSSNQLAMLSGFNQIINTIVSTGPNVLIRFKTDGFVTDKVHLKVHIQYEKSGKNRFI